MSGSDAAAIHHVVAKKYRKVAESPAGLFKYPTGEASALALGYPPELVGRIPAYVRERFVGVGNPFALGGIGEGEAVLDLGCGAGLDALVAAQLVGLGGHVAAIDLSREMLAVAERSRAAAGLPNVAFRQADVEDLPFPGASFNVVLSNGVLNLIPDKLAALREVFRVLKPGGRLQACDMSVAGDEPPPDKAPWSD